MSGLASLLDARAEELLRRWVDRLRQGIASGGETELELRDHVPILLRELGHALRSGHVAPRSGAAEEHGRQRYRLGFDLEAVVREYGILRNVIYDAVEEDGVMVSLPEVRIVADFVSNAIAEGVTEHNEQRLAEERVRVQESFDVARAAKEEAEAERAKLESLFAQAPVGIGIQEGPEHTYMFANDAYRAIVNRQDIVGKPILDALPELRGQGFDKLFDEVKRSGKPFVAEAQPATLLRDGKLETGWFSFIFAPKRDAKGEIDGILQCAFEVTAQVEAHRQIELALKRQSEFEQQLIGIVSHDLRNPLNVISMAAELLRQDETLSPRSLQFVVRIKNATDRAQRLVGDLLDFTKARLGGGIAVRPQPADLHKLVAAVVEEVGAAHPDRAIALTHHGDGAGEWDPDRLGQAVQNLVTNALKYGAAGAPVTVETRGTGEDVTLVVHNAGAPIPEDKLGVLFEPFERAGADDRSSADRSVGLGLYIVRHVIDAHHGKVDVASTAEAGTTFTVTLRRAFAPGRVLLQ